ncbi:hypothetical protein BSY238_2910 [Methyloversatilis sp. RAC08]|uniref:hypothetical protein n=1 Tax=Methyloversatilis sp. RAC08 TaxID=1842540 RepID=UPI00083D7D4D|nr:hypothetical protein [Methyloversatilis sp. RAC08]AOF82973.1 hypothetical protein BSY238_2910 [Methyloversatilis sp. RAC08]
MIAELLAWWRIDCLPEARRMGYRRESAALVVRHRRLRRHWADHLARTRAALLASAQRASNDRTPPKRAWIMGAGLLHDVPLAELLTMFERINLVDVAFAPAAHDAARRHPGRVACVMQDVTGLIADLSGDSTGAPALPEGAWCASVNLLSQLPLLPCGAWLRQGMTEPEVERRGRAIQQAHVDALQQAAHACLIIEYAQTHPPPGPADMPLLPGLPTRLAASGWLQHDTWHWPLNPPGETELPEGRAMQAWSR